MTKHMQPQQGVATRPPLVIRRVDAIAVALPLRKPMKMAAVTIATADNVLVRIEADGGLVGWGEAASAPTMTGDTQGSLVAAIRHLGSLLVGEDAWMRPALMRRLAAQHRIRFVGNQSGHDGTSNQSGAGHLRGGPVRRRWY